MCCAASCAAPCVTRICFGAKDPVMFRLVPALVRQMGEAYPELGRAQPLIEETPSLRKPASSRRWTAACACWTTNSASCPRGRTCLARRRSLLRHLWLPAGPDAGRAARKRAARSIRPVSTAPWPSKRPGARAAWSGSGETKGCGDLV